MAQEIDAQSVYLYHSIKWDLNYLAAILQHNKVALPSKTLEASML